MCIAYSIPETILLQRCSTELGIVSVGIINAITMECLISIHYFRVQNTSIPATMLISILIFLLTQKCSYMQREMKKGSVPIAHEIAGRVTQFDSSHMPFVFSNLSEIAYFYNTYNMKYSALRHMHSAVLVNMLYYS